MMHMLLSRRLVLVLSSVHSQSACPFVFASMGLAEAPKSIRGPMVRVVYMLTGSYVGHVGLRRIAIAITRPVQTCT